VIVGDAFAGQTVPWHLTTIEFAEQVRAQLAPGGVYVMNLIDARDLALARAEIRTLREVFDDVVVLAPPGAFADQRGPEELVNIVIVAGATLPSAQDIAVAATNQGSGSVAFHGAALARATESAVILRDQFAPVEQLLANA
jgi:spermidine synthase